VSNDINSTPVKCRPLFIFASVAVLLFASLPSFAQVDQPLAWLRDLEALKSASSGSMEHRISEVTIIRKEIEEWNALHSGSQVDLAPAPEQTWNSEQLRGQIDLLSQVVDRMIRNDPSHPFYLGTTVVNVTASAAALSPVSDSMDRTEVQNRNALTVKDAIDYLPGVSVDHKAPRNQSGISIGGFDMRQVPLYQDGVPQYVPFDGFVDLTRYLTNGVAEVQVAKGYSSPLLGPNLLGGVINLVTREPQRRLEGDAFTGTGSGNLLNSGLNAGSRWRKFFFQGSADRLQSTFYPISGNFQPGVQQPDDHRENAYQRDERVRGRAAWIPNSHDSYVFSYSNQKGKAGDPPYSGSAPVCPSGNAAVTYACVTPKYWRWPFWNTDSYYFNSKTGLGALSSVQFRAFYAQYPNTLDMFDDATYSTMNKNASSGVLNYNDHSVGTSGEFATQLWARNALGASFFVKDDTHREETTTFSAKNIPATTPQQSDRDQQSSFGVQDVITVSSRIRATLGFSADHLNGLQAQDLTTDKTHLVPFQVSGICPAPDTTTFTSCTDHVWAYNPLGSISYAAGEAGTFFVTFAQKSRFPTLKDRYSYKAGRAIPNPTLLPERGRNWTAGYSRTFARRTVAQIEFFRSDVRDEIQNISFLSPLCTGGGKGAGCMQAVNVGNETHQGVDLTVRTTPFSQMTFDATYAYLNRNISGSPGVFPTGTPRHKTLGTATVRLPHNALGILSVRYESGIVAMSDNSLPLPVSKFAATDLGALLPIRAGAAVQIGVKNLLDRNYYFWEGFPEAGRNWYLTLRYTF
jgi:iron complex outermembrane recepter protein